MRWKAMEPYGSLWKTQECSIGKLGKQKGKRSGVGMKKEGRKYVSMGQSMTLSDI